MTAELSSFGGPVRAVVIGAGGGIGGALARQLAASPAVSQVLAFSRHGSGPGGAGADARLVTGRLDLTDEDTIAAAAQMAATGPLHLVILATGILHADGIQPEKTWRSMEARALEAVFRINTIGPALVMKHFLPRLDRERKSVLAALSARVGSIADNRLGGWYAYRASKAALNQMIRTASVELARVNRKALCVGLHPGTVDTALSAPFRRNVPADRLFTPDVAAERLLGVLDRLTPAQSGRIFAWDGAEVPA